MSNNATVLLLMVLFLIGGMVMTFNLTENLMGLELGLGFGDIKGFMSGMWILTARLVGVILVALSIFVSYNIIKN